MIIFFVTLLLVGTVSGYMGWRMYRTSHLSQSSCAVMVERMRYVNYSDVCFVANDATESYTPLELINRLGGFEGLDRLRFNAGIMIETAKYITLIDPSGLVTAKQIRQDATELRRVALLVLWQHRLGLERMHLTTSVQQLSKLYIASTVKHLRLCDRLVDDVLLLTRLTMSAHAKMIRVDPGRLN